MVFNCFSISTNAVYNFDILIFLQFFFISSETFKPLYTSQNFIFLHYYKNIEKLNYFFNWIETKYLLVVIFRLFDITIL